MNYYKEVIDIITSKHVDFRAICIELAKNNPKAVIDAFKNAQQMQEIKKKIINYYKKSDDKFDIEQYINDLISKYYKN